MNKISRIFNISAAVLLVAAGMVFVVFEGYFLISKDFLLAESPALAMMQFFLRLLLAAGAAAAGLMTIVKKEKLFLSESLVILAAALITAPFLTNNFGLYFILVSGLFAASCFMVFRTSDNKAK